MGFKPSEVDRLLVACHRRCYVCHRFCGVKIERKRGGKGVGGKGRKRGQVTFREERDQVTFRMVFASFFFTQPIPHVIETSP
jgi:hypothetical protein